MKRTIYIFLLSGVLNTLTSCSDYLDIIPDNLATIENAFSLRVEAERFLFTCYTYLPSENTHESIAFSAGDECWYSGRQNHYAWRIARGNQSVSSPFMDFWTGSNGGKDLYQGIRQCNTFLDNINKVPDMEQGEKERWSAEVKFLKAYYHFYLLRLYGPIPIIDNNLDVDYMGEQLYPYREPIDVCFDYINGLLDEVINCPYLPTDIKENTDTERGRITRLIALSIKAKILVYKASPFYNGTEGSNGNEDYTDWKNKKGEELFPSNYSVQKWKDAAEACRIAIEACQAEGLKLYHWNPNYFQYNISDVTRLQLTLRNTVCEPWNSELIWGDSTQPVSSLQNSCTPRGLDPALTDNKTVTGTTSPNMKIAELFYSDHGVPIEEDVEYNFFNDRYNLKKGDDASKYYIKKDMQTAMFNFNREPRYYANFGFDAGLWYGQGRYDDSATGNTTALFFIEGLSGKRNANNSALGEYNSLTGFWGKKLVNFNNTFSGSSTYTVTRYPWPTLRLADLYLLYAEALNEVKSQPDNEVYQWVDSVRLRAGLPKVEEAWTKYSSSPQRYKNKLGMREIIQRERLIELTLEGKRYYDMRRWKRLDEMNQVTAWDLAQSEVQYYYRKKLLHTIQPVLPRDYLWPIKEGELLINKNIEQNPGW